VLEAGMTAEESGDARWHRAVEDNEIFIRVPRKRGLQAELVEEYRDVDQDEQDVDGREGAASGFVFERDEHVERAAGRVAKTHRIGKPRALSSRAIFGAAALRRLQFFATEAIPQSPTLAGKWWGMCPIMIAAKRLWLTEHFRRKMGLEC